MATQAKKKQKPKKEMNTLTDWKHQRKIEAANLAAKQKKARESKTPFTFIVNGKPITVLLSNYNIEMSLKSANGMGMSFKEYYIWKYGGKKEEKAKTQEERIEEIKAYVEAEEYDIEKLKNRIKGTKEEKQILNQQLKDLVRKFKINDICKATGIKYHKLHKIKSNPR